MGQELHRVYLDNEPWICDDDNKVFFKPGNRGKTVSFEDVEREGRHIASLEIVLIKGYPYYRDERLREFRRVGDPNVALTYDQFDLLPEKDQKLSIPRGEVFRRAMAKERAYWRRKLDADADSDRDRA